MTLVEVLIVVAIMALISGGVAIVVVRHQRESQRKAAVIDARALLQAVQIWQLNHPAQASDCVTVDRLKASGDLPPDRAVHDPWDNAYEIVCEGDAAGVSSAGADRKAGTEDDVAVGIACVRANESGHAKPIGCS